MKTSNVGYAVREIVKDYGMRLASDDGLAVHRSPYGAGYGIACHVSLAPLVEEVEIDELAAMRSDAAELVDLIAARVRNAHEKLVERTLSSLFEIGRNVQAVAVDMLIERGWRLDREWDIAQGNHD